jgi:hypothetical protein
MPLWMLYSTSVNIGADGITHLRGIEARLRDFLIFRFGGPPHSIDLLLSFAAGNVAGHARLGARSAAPFAWFLTRRRGTAELPGLFTPGKHHTQDTLRCGMMGRVSMHTRMKGP